MDFILFLMAKMTGSNGLTGSLHREANRLILFDFMQCAEKGQAKDQAYITVCSKTLGLKSTVFAPANDDGDFFRCLLQFLFEFLFNENLSLKKSAFEIWKLVITQKPEFLAAVLKTKSGERA